MTQLEMQSILKILKDKEVNIFSIKMSKNLKWYNDFRNDNRKLTQLEYDILKEWLKS